MQRSEGGLYVDMSSFLAFGREHVEWNYEKTGNPVYLHIVQRRKPEADEADRPLKKPTLLAIGMCCFGEKAPTLPELSNNLGCTKFRKTGKSCCTVIAPHSASLKFQHKLSPA